MDDWKDRVMPFDDFDDEKLQACKDWLAVKKAELAQRKKQFEEQYPMWPPEHNHRRLEELEAMEFRIQMNEWELEMFIKETEDS